MASTHHSFMILLSLYLVNSIPENQFDEQSLHEQIEQHRRDVLKEIGDIRDSINQKIFTPETFRTGSPREQVADYESLEEKIAQNTRDILKHNNKVRQDIIRDANKFKPEAFTFASSSEPITDDDNFNENVSHNIRDNILTFIDKLRETVKRDDNVHKPVKVKISSSNEQLTDNETSSANRTTTDDVLSYINNLQDAIVTEEKIRKSFRGIPSSGKGTDDTIFYQHVRKIYNLLGDMFEDHDKVQLFRDMLLNLTANCQPEETA